MLRRQPGTVNAQPVYSGGGGGGGGGGGFVPVTQQYATLTGVGGGYEMDTATTTAMPGIPNTGLGDTSTSYLLLLGLMLVMGELALLGYKRFKKI